MRLIRPRFTVAELSAIFAVVGFLFTTGGAHGAIARHDRAVPILMYHVIADAPDGAAYGNLFVRPDDFAAQMHWLATHGYRAVTLHRVYEYWRHGLPLPARPVVLTFDDGTMGQHVHALPVLRALHWPGVLNLKVNALSSPLSLPDWRVRALLAAGWELDAHSLTHPDLRKLDKTALAFELIESKAAVERITGRPCRTFAYPYGLYDERVVQAVADAGYELAFGWLPGPWRPLEAPRVPAPPRHGARRLALKLAGLRRRGR